MRRCLRLLFLLGLLASAPAAAQDLTVSGFDPVGPATDYVTWSERVEPDSVRPGDAFLLILEAQIARPWKLYGLESELPPLEDGPRPYGVEVALADSLAAVLSAERPAQSAPKTGFDPNFGIDLQWFYDSARFAFPFTVDSAATPGALAITGTVRFQICDDDRGLCLPPTPAPFSQTVIVDPECSPSDPDAAGACEGDGAALDAMLADLRATEDGPAETPTGRRGMFGFLLLAIGAGLASLLTPCVFPMIPLTVSYFTKQDRGKAVRMALLFGASIVLTFTFLGIVMALVVGAAGAQTIAANPWVNLFIAGVLVVFALSLLGLFELRLPSALVNYSNKQSTSRSGIVGILFMGLTLTLVSFSCTAPFVGGLLAAAAGGSWVYPLFGMVAFSTAFAAPFVLLALFPGALERLPRSGSWMNAFKVVLGFIELAAATKFLSNADLVWGWGLISRPLAIAFIAVIFVVTGIYLLGKLRLAHEPEVGTVGVGRLLSGMAFIALGLYMLPGLLGAPLNALDAYLPPRQGTDVSLLSATALATGSAASEEHWVVDDIEAAMDQGREMGRPVLIDFTGYTCTNCREMEANVFPRAAVASRMQEDFVLLRLYTDGLDRGPEFQRYQLGLTGTVALPTYAVVTSADERLVARTSGLMDEEEFLAFLDRASRAVQTAVTR